MKALLEYDDHYSSYNDIYPFGLRVNNETVLLDSLGVSYAPIRHRTITRNNSNWKYKAFGLRELIWVDHFPGPTMSVRQCVKKVGKY